MTPRANRFDVAIIGGGHNALVAAALIARAGRSVVVCEALPRLGGGAALSTLMPGMRAPQCAHTVTGFPPALIRKLGLARHGLRVLQTHMPALALDAGGRHIPLGGRRRRDARSTREAIYQWSRADAEAWPAFARRLDALTRLLLPLVTHPPLPYAGLDWRQRLGWFLHAARLRRLGAGGMGEALRLLPSNAADMIEDVFETPLLSGALVFDAVLGGHRGPRAPGTVFAWLWARALAQSGAGVMQVAGGPAALADALRASAVAKGADIRTRARVIGIRVEEDRACGLILANGDEIGAGAVISTIDARTTWVDLVGTAHLDTGLVRDLSAIRSAPSAVKVNLALGCLPSFPRAAPDDLRGRLVIAPGVDEVERAANPRKYGATTDHPVMEATIPSLADETLAPEGRHIMSVIVPFAPMSPAEGWDTAGDALVARVIKTLGDYAPDLPDAVMAGEVLTPPDIVSHCGVPGGDWHHAEIAFDQSLAMRPVPRLAPGPDDPGSPVRGLHLGGASAHPGGGLNGRAGALAATSVLSNLRRNRSGGGR